MILLALALLQAPAPTVGDTIWVERSTPLPPGHVARLPDWSPEGDVELLGAPQLSQHGGDIIVRFPLVAWRPGIHRFDVPGPTLIGPEGQTVQVADEERILEVASVLPDEPAEDLAVRPPTGIVGRPVHAWLPILLMLLGAGWLLAPVWWWWVRRGRATVTEFEGAPVPAVPVEQWAAVGEHRAVLAVATDRVRHALVLRVPEAHPGLDTDACVAALRAAAPPWDPTPVVDVLESLDGARFRPEGPEEVLALCQRADAVADGLREEAA